MKTLTRESLAAQINGTSTLCRTINVESKLEIKIGDMYNNRGKTESWQGENADSSFVNETQYGYEYVFICREKVPCHFVDYDNEEECEFLDCVDMSHEGEVLISKDTKFRIVDIANDDDYKEMGYYEVVVELVN
jgi:hypothetical protein